MKMIAYLWLLLAVGSLLNGCVQSSDQWEQVRRKRTEEFIAHRSEYEQLKQLAWQCPGTDGIGGTTLGGEQYHRCPEASLLAEKLGVMFVANSRTRHFGRDLVFSLSSSANEATGQSLMLPWSHDRSFSFWWREETKDCDHLARSQLGLHVEREPLPEGGGHWCYYIKEAIQLR